jgi:hypothetical protein
MTTRNAVNFSLNHDEMHRQLADTEPSAMDQLRARLRAANPVPPDYSHLNDPDLLKRLQAHWAAEYRQFEAQRWAENPDGGDDDAGPVEPTRRERRRTLTTAIKQAAKAGVIVSGATIAPDGTISISFEKPSIASHGNDNDRDRNEWDTVQ